MHFVHEKFHFGNTAPWKHAFGEACIYGKDIYCVC